MKIPYLFSQCVLFSYSLSQTYNSHLKSLDANFNNFASLVLFLMINFSLVMGPIILLLCISIKVLVYDRHSKCHNIENEFYCLPLNIKLFWGVGDIR